MGSLDGRVALITGGARGQGRSHAVALAREGADIVVCDWFGGLEGIRYPLSTPEDLEQTVALVEAEDRRCLAAEADVRDLAALEQLVARATAELGRVDIACANAGIATTSGQAVYEMSAETWRQVVDIDLTGVFNTIRAVGPGMVERRYGRIIATSSMMGRTGGAHIAGYAAAKWGVIGLVKCAAHDFAPYGVTVNAIAPGNVDTPMIQNDAIRRLMRPDLENPTREDCGSGVPAAAPAPDALGRPRGDLAGGALPGRRGGARGERHRHVDRRGRVGAGHRLNPAAAPQPTETSFSRAGSLPGRARPGRSVADRGSRPMKYLIQHPEPIGVEVDLPSAGEVVAVARAVEAAGWDGLAFTEHPAPGRRWLAEGGGHQTLDPFVALGAAAAVTDRIRLLTYLSVVPYRNPMLLAKSAATVDIISGGRFILGVGTGYLKTEFFALGVDFDERNALFDEALDVLALHWSGEPFSYRGRHFDARDVLALPAPPRRSIPIWIGGNSRLTRRRVAQRAQGWMPMTGPAEMAATTRTAHISDHGELRTAIEQLREAAGERAGEIDVMVLYTDDSILRPGVEVERHRDQLGRLAELGATWVSFAFDFSKQADTLAFVEGFAGSYLGSDRI